MMPAGRQCPASGGVQVPATLDAWPTLATGTIFRPQGSSSMSGTTTKLTAAAEDYFADLQRVRASGGATRERSLYGPLNNLLTAVGATLKPKVFCVQELADQGAGHPDFGLYAAKQVQKGAPREGQTPERGVVEVKFPGDDAWLTAARDQASRYWERYRLVLVTNTRDFVLVGEDADGRPATLETLRLAGSSSDFLRRLEKPRAFARDAGASLGEYLARALSHRAVLTEPKDLAWLLASYARDGLARVEAAGGAPTLAAVREALEEARHSSGGSHVAYCLARPVHRGEGATHSTATTLCPHRGILRAGARRRSRVCRRADA